MFRPLYDLARRLFRRPHPPELSRLIVGSTGSGKSEGELVDLVRLADRRDCQEVQYKTPHLHEQEYRTKLATLRAGERIVRTRDGMTVERVTMFRTPRRRFDQLTRDAMERIRSRPIYRRPTTPLEATANGLVPGRLPSLSSCQCSPPSC